MKSLRISWAVSARNVHLLITSEQRQNILLLHDIASGRAQMKSFRISYTEPKPCTANAYTTSLQHTVSHITRHPMTRYACPNSTACTHCTSTDYLTVFKTYCFSVILNPGGLSSKRSRISYAEPKQSTSTSTDYLTVLKTYCFPSKSRMCALSSKRSRISWDSSSTHHPSSLERTLHNTRLFLRKPIPPRLPHRDDNTHLSPRHFARQLTPIPSTRQLPPSHTHA